MALETVREHKTRSFLTVLGVVIGVAAMIFVASILVGVSRDVQGYLEDYGTNTLFLFRFDIGIHTGRMTRRGARAQAAHAAKMPRRSWPNAPHVQERDRGSYAAHRASTQRPTPQVARYGTHEITNLDYTGTNSAYQDVYNAQRHSGPLLHRLRRRASRRCRRHRLRNRQELLPRP